MKCLYKLKWSAGKNRWDLCDPMMLDSNGDPAFIMDFPDCENFRRQFNDPKKDKERLYVVCVNKVSKCGECNDIK